MRGRWKLVRCRASPPRRLEAGDDGERLLPEIYIQVTTGVPQATVTYVVVTKQGFAPSPPMRTLPLLLALLASTAFAQPEAHRASDSRGVRVSPTATAIVDRANLDRPAMQRIGGLTFYATRGDFDASNPGLPVEDFEDIDVAPATFCASFSPVDAYTDDDCYDPGILMAPLSIAAVGPTQTAPDAVIALGAGYFGQPSTVVGANLEVDTTEIRFDPGVYAAGMDVHAFFGNPAIAVDVYDAGGSLLGSTTIPGVQEGTFFGVRSDGAAIGAIRLDAAKDYTMLDNVAAGTIGGDLTFDPALLTTVLEAGESGTATATITNHTDQTVAYDVALSAAPAFVTDVTPSTGAIPPDGSIDVVVTFDATPLIAGTYAGSLLVETDLVASPDAFVLPVELVVTGTAACAITTGAVPFDDTIVGTSSSEEVTVENDGTAACDLTGASADGPFSVESFSVTSLAPGAAETITVVYTPTEAGDDTGTLTVTTDGGDLTAALLGSALDPPTPVVDPDALAFDVAVDGTASQAFTLSNAGGAAAADLEYSIYVAAARPAGRTTPEQANPQQANPERAAQHERLRETVAPPEGWATSGLTHTAASLRHDPQSQSLGTPRALERGGGVTVTHSASQEIVPGYGVACPTPPTSWWRVFDLSAFAIDTELRVTSVDIGIEAATSGTTTVSLYTLDGELVSSNLTLVATATLDVSPADALSIATVPILATFAADDVIAVAWTVPQEGVLFGGNPDGQTGPTYIQADACGASEPVDIADIGFGLSHWVLNVNGETGPPLVTVAPQSGSIAPGASNEITVTVDATGFEPGSYPFELLLSTNDPNTPTLTMDVTVEVAPSVANEDEGLPVAFALAQNAPNPFVNGTTITYALPEATHVTLEVYDAVGRRVAVLVDEDLVAGRHEATWGAGSMASGVYLYRIQAGDYRKTLKMALVR